MSKGFEKDNSLQVANCKLQIAKLNAILFFSFAFCILHFAFCTDVHAARPLVTEDAVVAGRGITQLEVGIDYTKIGDKGEGTTLLISPIHGVMEDTEFYLKIPYISGRPDSPSIKAEGWGDMSFVMKHLLAEEDKKMPAFLISMSIKLPSGDKDKGLGTGDTNVGFLGVATKGFGPATLHLNAGYTFVGRQKESRQDNQVNYGIAGEYAVGKKTHVVGEVYGLYHPAYESEEIERRAMLGLTYRINDTLTLDCAAKRGFLGARDEYGFVGGLTITF